MEIYTRPIYTAKEVSVKCADYQAMIDSSENEEYIRICKQAMMRLAAHCPEVICTKQESDEYWKFARGE